MDPNETLSKIRALAADVIEMVNDTTGTYGQADIDDASVELANQTQALDEWLENGGFLPTDWTHEGRRGR